RGEGRVHQPRAALGVGADHAPDELADAPAPGTEAPPSHEREGGGGDEQDERPRRQELVELSQEIAERAHAVPRYRARAGAGDRLRSADARSMKMRPHLPVTRGTHG